MKHFLALFFLAGLAVAEAQFSRPPKDRRDAEPQIATKPPQGRRNAEPQIATRLL
ncbi:hypothetical protein HBI24_110000 [Parastagonospora nodorum]|nr:hypothetical protein HBI24_110000 [Parastagonospora nodorum]KAH6041398.1 hypothetical protein HBI54_146810 [Parastagonospora nodorum]KAH6215041.1 hypothetical protein HBI53_098820 [Parastagonospora nodorum]KAH6415012.1 hypothetical protein HBI14_117580 [Parastagonospora nodorum]